MWTQHLNALDSALDLDSAARTQVLSWNYAEALVDNVPHRHTYFEICTVGAWGTGEFRVEGTPHPIGSGDTFFARPGVVHQIVNTQEQGMELSWVSFALDGPGDLARSFAESEVLVAHDAMVGAIWNALRHTSSPAIARPLAQALLLAILNAGGAPVENTPRLPVDARARQARLALRYIHDNLGKKLSLPEVAAHIHVSPRQLVRLFALFVGTSPAAYIERARLDRAGSLLLRSDRAIKDVAREVGFEDVAHFSRVFARFNGNPPGDFRKRGGPLIERPSGPNIQKEGELV